MSPHPLPRMVATIIMSLESSHHFLLYSFGEEPPEENRVHLGHAIMSFYAALIDLLGRCAPEMHVSTPPRGEETVGWERAGHAWPAFNLSTQALGSIHVAHLGVVLGCDAGDTLMTKTSSGPNPMEPK